MDASAPALPRQTPAVPDVSGCPMTTFPVHDTSIRGCPSKAAGTTCGGDTSRISRYARPSTIRCRTNRSDCVAHPAHAAHPYASSATVPSYSRPDHHLHHTDIGIPQHVANLSPEPFSGLPVGDKRAFPSLTVSAPNSSQNDNSLQNRRDRRVVRRPRRPLLSRPVRLSRRVDMSPFTANGGLRRGPWSAVEDRLSGGV